MPLTLLKISYLLISRMEASLQEQALFWVTASDKSAAMAFCAELSTFTERISTNMLALANCLRRWGIQAPQLNCSEIVDALIIHSEHVLASREHVLKVLRKFNAAVETEPAGQLINSFNKGFCQGIRAELLELQGKIERQEFGLAQAALPDTAPACHGCVENHV